MPTGVRRLPTDVPGLTPEAVQSLAKPARFGRMSRQYVKMRIVNEVKRLEALLAVMPVELQRLRDWLARNP